MGAEADAVVLAADTFIAAYEGSGILMYERDQAGPGFIKGGPVESEPPWNEQAAMAKMVPHAGVRAREREIRQRVSGTTSVRGGSDANTRLAARALANMAPAISREEAARLAGDFDAWAGLYFALPANDGLPQWLSIMLPSGGPPPDCPYCGLGCLRVNAAVGAVICGYRRCAANRAEPRQWARVGRDDRGHLCWRWSDGTVQP